MSAFDSISVPLPQALAGALRRLAHIAHVSSWDQWASQKLTPTQRKILEHLNGRQRPASLGAVAKDLQVTPATASDSIAALEAKGLVRKRKSAGDARALAIGLTAEGRKCAASLAELPDPLLAAFGALEAAEQEALYRTAIKMIRTLQEVGQMPITRMCVRCQYFDPFRYPDSPTPHHCHLVGAPFADRHLRIDCPDQVFNPPAAQHALWIRFSSAPPARESAAPAKDADGRASAPRGS